MRAATSIGLLTILAVSGGCATIGSSAVRTGRAMQAYEGRVQVRVTDSPPGAVVLGQVEAHGTSKLSDVVGEFARRVASLGGNFGKIDHMHVRFEEVTTPQTQTYQCGNSTCTRTTMVTSEVGTTLIEGRAMRYGGSR